MEVVKSKDGVHEAERPVPKITISISFLHVSWMLHRLITVKIITYMGYPQESKVIQRSEIS